MKMTEQQKIAAKLGLFDPVAALLKDESEKIAAVIDRLPDENPQAITLDHIDGENKQAAPLASDIASSALGTAGAATRLGTKYLKNLGVPKKVTDAGTSVSKGLRQWKKHIDQTKQGSEETGNKSAAFAPEGEVEQGWADEAAQKLQEWVAQGKDPRHFAEAYAKETAPTGRSALIGGLGGAGLGAGAGALARSLAGSHARGSTGLWAAGGALAGGLLGARGLPRQQRRQGEEIAQYAIASQLGQPKQGSEEKLALPAGMMSPGAGVEAELTARASQALKEHTAAGGDPAEFVQQFAEKESPIGRNALIGAAGGGLTAGAGGLAGYSLGRLLMGGRGSPGLGFPAAIAAGGALGGAIGHPYGQRKLHRHLAEAALAQHQGQGMEQGMEQGMDPSMGQGKEGAAKTAQPPMQQGQMQQGQMQGQMPQMGSPEMQAQQAMMDAEAMKADPLEAQNETLRKVIQNQKLKLELADLTTKVMQAAQPPQMPQMGPEEGPEAGGDGQMMGDPMEYMRQALTE